MAYRQRAYLRAGVAWACAWAARRRRAGGAEQGDGDSVSAECDGTWSSTPTQSLLTLSFSSICVARSSTCPHDMQRVPSGAMVRFMGQVAGRQQIHAPLYRD